MRAALFSAVAALAVLAPLFAQQPADEDPSLEIIKAYQAQSQEVSQTVNVGSQKMADVVNLFPAQRGGFFHGSVYEYHRNDNLDARNFFDPVGEALPEYKRNQFGATIGVALGNRVHIMGSYDGLRINRGSTLLSHVPTPEMKLGDFSGSSVIPLDPLSGQAFANGRIPSSRIHPVARLLLPVYPDPNRPDLSRNFGNSQPFVLRRNGISSRLDFEMNEHSRVSVSYEAALARERGVDPLPIFGADTESNGHQFSVSHTRTINPNLTGTLRVEYSREIESTLPRTARQAGLLKGLGISGLAAEGLDEEGYPVVSVAGYAGFGDTGTPDGSVFNTFELEADQSYSHRSHQLRFEQRLRFRQINNHRSPSLKRGNFSFTGRFTGEPFADFLLGMAESASQAIGLSRQDLRGRRLELSLVDDWKVSSRLNLTLALGYAYLGPYFSRQNNLSVLRPLVFEPVGGDLLPIGQVSGQDKAPPGSVVKRDLNNFWPGIGVAVKPFENGSLVIRGGYWLQYDTIDSSWFLDYMGRNYPFYYTVQAQAAKGGTPLDLSDPFSGATLTERTVRDIETTLRSPYIQEWEFSVESQFHENWEVQASYQGSKSTRLIRVLPSNIPLPGPGEVAGRRPNPAFGSTRILTNGASASEHGLDLSAERRLSRGFSLKSGLEWERGLNDRSDMPSNPRDFRSERAPAADPPVSLFFNYIVDLPSFGEAGAASDSKWIWKVLGGWRLSGITRFQAGSPFNVHIPGDWNNDGLSGDRPNRLASGALASGQDIDRWFDPSAFEYPSAFGFGNAGRNILRGPSYRNWDVSLAKTSRLPNGHRFEVRIEFFNALNQVNFEAPDHHFGTESFGKIFGAERAREIEAAVKYSF